MYTACLKKYLEGNFWSKMKIIVKAKKNYTMRGSLHLFGEKQLKN